MTRSQTADRLTESVGAFTDKIDVSALTDKIDTEAILHRAETGAAELLDSATDAEGRPKRGVLIGLALGVLALVLLRRLLR